MDKMTSLPGYRLLSSTSNKLKLFCSHSETPCIKRGLNPEDEPCISKIELVTAISVGQGMTKSHYLKIFKSQYLVEFLRYGYNFLHVIITFIGFKITFSNIRSHGAPLLISKGWRLAPPPGFS